MEEHGKTWGGVLLCVLPKQAQNLGRDSPPPAFFFLVTLMRINLRTMKCAYFKHAVQWTFSKFTDLYKHCCSPILELFLYFKNLGKKRSVLRRILSQWNVSETAFQMFVKCSTYWEGLWSRIHMQRTPTLCPWEMCLWAGCVILGSTDIWARK